MLEVLDAVQAVLPDVIIITTIACYSFIGIMLGGYVARRVRRML